MPRSAANIQAQIDTLEAAQADTLTSMTADNVGVVNATYDARQKILDKLYLQLERANGTPMQVRGHQTGLR